MDSEIWALAGVVVGALLGAGAQILSTYLQDRRAQRRWLQSERVRVYQTFTGAITHAVEGARSRHQSGGDDPALSEAWWQLLIFGSSSAAVIGARWMESVDRLSVQHAEGQDPFEPLFRVAELRTEFLNQVRSEVGSDRLSAADTPYL